MWQTLVAIRLALRLTIQRLKRGPVHDRLIMLGSVGETCAVHWELCAPCMNVLIVTVWSAKLSSTL